jgi:hypothetical protein
VKEDPQKKKNISGIFPTCTALLSTFTKFIVKNRIKLTELPFKNVRRKRNVFFRLGFFHFVQSYDRSKALLEISYVPSKMIISRRYCKIKPYITDPFRKSATLEMILPYELL